MKRRKKKKSNPKQDTRRSRNEFMKKLKQVASCLGDASVLNLLSEEDITVMFHCRTRPPKIITDDNDIHISSKTLRLLNQNFSYLVHHTFITIKECETKLSLYDFSVYAETLLLNWRDLSGKKSKTGEAIKAAFPVFNQDFTKIRADVHLEIGKCLETLAWLYSDFMHSIVYFKVANVEKPSSPYDKRAFFNNYLVKLYKTENELFAVNGHKRTIYRLAINHMHVITPLTRTPAELGINSVIQAFPLKVFIQKHALERMQERLGANFVFQSYLYIVPAILGKPILTDNTSSYLFPIFHEKIKLGYLKADIIGDKLLIRTFLFLTNNGTPEGKKLHKLLGVQKADKKYTGIDKLSTFILSDIKNNEKLKALFGKAGCGDLFKLDKNILSMPEKKEITCAKFLSHYLQVQGEAEG